MTEINFTRKNPHHTLSKKIDDLKQLFVLALLVGEQSNFSLIPVPEYGIEERRDASGMLRKYILAKCLLGCGYSYEVRIDHLVNYTERESRNGNGGTKCPHCCDIVYGVINETSENGGKVYYMSLTAENLSYNKIGSALDWDERWTTPQKKIFNMYPIAEYYSPYYKTIEKRALKYVEDEGILKGVDDLPDIIKVLPGATEVFAHTRSFGKKIFLNLCKSIELQCSEIKCLQDLEDRWHDAFKEYYDHGSIVPSCYGDLPIARVLKDNPIVYKNKINKKTAIVQGVSVCEEESNLKKFFK